MGRPPVEWPIPVYQAEFRERIVAVFRAPLAALRSRISAPILPEVVRGQGIVMLCLQQGRRVKSLGSDRVLASEFRTAEVWTPVRLRAACRPDVHGLYLLRFTSDAPSLGRLLRAALGGAAESMHLQHRSNSKAVRAEVFSFAASERLADLDLIRKNDEAPWQPGSLFSTQEEVERLLLHPERQFVFHDAEQVVYGVPVHHYARSTTPVHPVGVQARLVADSLGLTTSALQLDHVLLQKRCTHTWAFPPERIVLVSNLLHGEQSGWAAQTRSLAA